MGKLPNTFDGFMNMIAQRALEKGVEVNATTIVDLLDEKEQQFMEIMIKCISEEIEKLPLDVQEDFSKTRDHVKFMSLKSGVFKDNPKTFEYIKKDLLESHEEREEYEQCALIKNLKNK